MKRVLIADDEERIVRLLKSMIDWENLSLELVGVAHNGVDALEKVKSLGVDILLADIQMPGMDGLELTAQGMAYNPNLAVIVISGYKEFDYAYKAIKQGVSDYLIKPVNKYDLDKSLRRILNMQQVDNVMLKEELLKFRREQLMLNYIHGVTSGTKSLQDLNQQSDMNFHPGLFAMMLVNLSCQDKTVVLDSALGRIGRLMTENLSDLSTDLEYVTLYQSCYCLINFSENRENEVCSTLKSLKKELEVRLAETLSLTVTMGVSRFVTDHAQLLDACVQARLACKSACVLGREKPIFAEKIEISEPSQMLTLAQTAAFLKVLTREDATSLEEFLQNLLAEHSDLLAKKPWQMEQILYELLDVFLGEMAKAQVAVEPGQEEHLVADILGGESLATIPTSLAKWMGEKLEAYGATKKNPYRDSIMNARNYIDENFARQITLTDICEQVGFSYHYFSALYKQETGEGILDYITQARIRHAQKLLTTTTLNLQTVANQSGYVDMKHFNKTFQKIVGIRPLEYRKLRS